MRCEDGLGAEEMRLNGRELGPECEVASAVAGLTKQMTTLTGEVRTLVGLHREIIRWLLFVVCVIALGKEAGNVIDRLVGNKAVMAQTK